MGRARKARLRSRSARAESIALSTPASRGETAGNIAAYIDEPKPTRLRTVIYATGIAIAVVLAVVAYYAFVKAPPTLPPRAVDTTSDSQTNGSATPATQPAADAATQPLPGTAAPAAENPPEYPALVPDAAHEARVNAAKARQAAAAKQALPVEAAPPPPPPVQPAPVVVAPPVAPPAPPPKPDRWQQMSEGLASCARQELFQRAGCEQRVRAQYCDGFWGQVPQCAIVRDIDHGG